MRGLNFFWRIRGLKFTPEKMRGLKILLKKLRGLKNSVIFPENTPGAYSPLKMSAPLKGNLSSLFDPFQYSSSKRSALHEMDNLSSSASCWYGQIQRRFLVKYITLPVTNDQWTHKGKNTRVAEVRTVVLLLHTEDLNPMLGRSVWSICQTICSRWSGVWGAWGYHNAQQLLNSGLFQRKYTVMSLGFQKPFVQKTFRFPKTIFGTFLQKICQTGIYFWKSGSASFE